jgi:hypothetical protein
MQNKPNFRKSQMNVNIYNTTDYENETAFRRGKNKPNSNPIKPNFQKAQMNANSLITKDYRKNNDFAVRKNKPNFRNAQNERKLNFNKGLQKKRCFSVQKNKPKQTQFQIGSQRSDVRSQKPDYLLSVLCYLFSVLCFLMQPKLLNFHHKNSLTVGPNSVKYRFLCNESECFYEKLYGKERKRRA